MQELSDTEIAEIKKRYEAATPGPWISYVEGRDHQSGDHFIQTRGEEDIYLYGNTIADQDFIAHARQDIPALIAEIERLRGEQAASVIVPKEVTSLCTNEISDISWCDIDLIGFQWANGGRDLVLSLLPASPDRDAPETRILLCKWAAGLTVNLAFPGDHGRYPVTSDTVIEKTETGRWKIFFDFAGDGELSFTCSELAISWVEYCSNNTEKSPQ